VAKIDSGVEYAAVGTKGRPGEEQEVVSPVIDGCN